MKKVNNVHVLIILVATISILIGVYKVLQGESFMDHLASIMLGVALFGTGVISYKEEKDENEKASSRQCE